MKIDLDYFLEQKIDEALDLVNQRNPGLQWTKEQLVKVLIGRGLSHMFREHIRRRVNLKGIYKKPPPDDAWKAMTVTNVSRSGIGFTMIDRCRVRPKEILDVEFFLQGKESRNIAKRVLVRHITDNYIGAEFCEFSEQEIVFEVL